MESRTRFEEIYNAALVEPPERRAEFVRQACGGDEPLRREVESLLGWDSAAEGLAPGTRLGPYGILERAGAGGMGEVYKARDTRLERLVAIKVVSAQLAADPACRARLEREAKAVSALNHPHICVLHDVGRDGEIDYLVMEYLEGETLAQQIARGPLPVADVVRYGIEIAGALAAAHAAGILHRDLKPGNIMLTKSGVKLLDFGLARTVDSTGASEVTATGVLVGTPPYMSPEQVRGEVLDERTDVFSFGAVLYEMVTGRCPFAADSRAGVIAAILDRQPERPSKINADVPLRLEQVIQTCLRKHRGERPNTIEHTATVLHHVAAKHGRAAMATRRARRRVQWTAVSSLALVVLLATGLWPATQPVTRITALTSDSAWKNFSLLVDRERVLYATGAQPGVANAAAGEFWSISVNGGNARIEPKPCDLPSQTPMINFVSYPARKVMFECMDREDQVSGDFYLMDFDGGNPRRIGRHIRFEMAGLSPDAQTLLMSRPTGLFVRPVRGGEERFLTGHVKGSTFYYSVWHPSGSTIAFMTLKDDAPGRLGKVTAWQVRADGSGLRQFMPDFPQSQETIHWSPRGERLYFTSAGDIHYLETGLRWLGWMRRPKPVRLTNGPIAFALPYEDPDNPLVCFARGTVSQAEAMKLDPQTDHFQPYLGGLHGSDLDFSPDGKWIAYVSFPQGHLWKIRTDGSGKVVLDDAGLATMPRWSPDGRRIVFSSAPKGMQLAVGAWEVFSISVNGGDRSRLKGLHGHAVDANWSPDGRSLVFSYSKDTVSRREQMHVSSPRREQRRDACCAGFPGAVVAAMVSLRRAPCRTGLRRTVSLPLRLQDR